MSVSPTETRIDTVHLAFTLNGNAVSVDVEPRVMLIDLLRDQLGLKGSQRSCDVQVCGACTVLLDGQAVSSCCTLAYEADGKSVTTIEGLGSGNDPDPVQAAFVQTGAIQCGFCTPGLVLTTKALLAENPDPGRDQIERYLGGNLCRCTGYWRILDAVELAAKLSEDDS